MAATQGCGVLTSKHQVYHAARTEGLRTQGNVIDKQCTRKCHLDPELIQPLRSIDHSIIASVHLISVCHSKDQLPLKSKYLLNNSERDASQREILTGRYEPPI